MISGRVRIEEIWVGLGDYGRNLNGFILFLESFEGLSDVWGFQGYIK